MISITTKSHIIVYWVRELILLISVAQNITIAASINRDLKD